MFCPASKKSKSIIRLGDCRVEDDESQVSQKEIFAAITKLNYSVQEPVAGQDNRGELTDGGYKKWLTVGVLLILFALGYFAIKYFGLLEIMAKLNEQHISYWLIFLIGLLASFHCVGMCGGGGHLHRPPS